MKKTLGIKGTRQNFIISRENNESPATDAAQRSVKRKEKISRTNVLVLSTLVLFNCKTTLYLRNADFNVVVITLKGENRLLDHNQGSKISEGSYKHAHTAN
jgi:hypothetical protein